MRGEHRLRSCLLVGSFVTHEPESQGSCLGAQQTGSLGNRAMARDYFGDRICQAPIVEPRPSSIPFRGVGLTRSMCGLQLSPGG